MVDVMLFLGNPSGSSSVMMTVCECAGREAEQMHDQHFFL